MGDFQFWLYVIIGVIYLLSRLSKKSKGESAEIPADDNQGQRPRPTNTEKQLTFEELLREISEAKSPGPQPQTIATEHVKKVTARVDYDEDLEDEAEVEEDANYDYRKKDEIYEVYERAKSEAFARPSLEEIDWKKEKSQIAFEKFKGFEEEQKPDLMKQYLSDLNNPDGLKKAFVVSEIFKTKF